MHHKTNTLRLAFLLSEMDAYLAELKAFAQRQHDRNPASHYGTFLKGQAFSFEAMLKNWRERMSEIKWVEPEDN